MLYSFWGWPTSDSTIKISIFIIYQLQCVSDYLSTIPTAKFHPPPSKNTKAWFSKFWEDFFNIFTHWFIWIDNSQQIMLKNAHSNSALPTIPETASVWIGCVAKRSPTVRVYIRLVPFFIFGGEREEKRKEERKEILHLFFKEKRNNENFFIIPTTFKFCSFKFHTPFNIAPFPWNHYFETQSQLNSTPI